MKTTSKGRRAPQKKHPPRITLRDRVALLETAARVFMSTIDSLREDTGVLVPAALQDIEDRLVKLESAKAKRKAKR